MRIGEIEFGERPVFLAPMEDVTDASFRHLCKEFGAGLVYTEFVSADALIRGVDSSLRKMRVADTERPVAIQIYGRDTATMVEAARICEEVKPDILDINFGCPVKRVAGKGAGSGLLRNIPLMLEITREVAKAVSLPVTVKTRLGWDCNEIVIESLAKQLQDAGAAAITIHGRTRSQMYKGVADWEPIRRVAENPRISVPIIGNGDILTGEDAVMRFETTGVDAVMIGRGSIGRPWMFERVMACLRGEEAPRHDYSWYIDVLKRQIDESIEKCGEYRGILHIRRHIAMTPIFKGIPDFKSMRIALLRADSRETLFDLLDEVPRKFDVSVVDLNSPLN